MKRLIEITVLIVLLGVLFIFGKPKIAAYYNNKGVECYQNGLQEKAISSFKKALAIDSSSAVAHYNMANSYAEMKEIDKAAAEYGKAAELDPDNIEVHLSLIQLYLENDMYQETLDMLSRTQQKFPNNPEIKKLLKEAWVKYMVDHSNKSVKSFVKGNKAEAYSLLNKILEFDPDFVHANYLLAHFYTIDGNYREAEKKLKEIIIKSPEFIDSYKLLGDIYYQEGRFEEAIQIYKKGLTLNYNDSELHNGLGLAFMRIEAYDNAIAHLKKANQLEPNNLNIQYSLASVYRDNNMLERAVEEYKRLIYNMPEYPNIHNDLADIYLRQGKQEQAFAEYRKEIENCHKRLAENPKDEVALSDLAYAYAGLKKYNQAKDIIGKALKINPGYREAYLTLARIEENLENPHKALDALTKAKELSMRGDFINRDVARVKGNAGLPFYESSSLDKVYLVNGKVLEGIIKDENEEKVTMDIFVGKSWGTISLPRGRIRHLIKAGEENNF
ncbi:MAG: tetratricopeptide repeat protein [Candidatus Omnitrophica bacterium]|nr:tetratricopeptide repeat protein [Candidatus Omnitrophota bacterium]MBD3269865.1 tetratricopeptide repeat protein [Candidatus Omnitrophota bacterium]